MTPKDYIDKAKKREKDSFSLRKLDSLTLLLDSINRAKQIEAVKEVTEKCLEIVKTL